MSKLDEIIESLAERQEEPKEGHFERFSSKLTRQGIRSRYLKLSFLKIAAVLVIILLSANLFVYFNNPAVENQRSSNQNKEIREAGFYYTNQINSGISDLEKMAKEGIGSEKDLFQVKKELAEMDSLFQKVRKDYQSNPNDERILNAMIEYYQTKLDIVNTIKNDLENVKQQKVKYNENNKI